MLKDVDKVGDKHDVINVKNGFGRNYLLPRGLAIIGNESNMGRLNEMIRREEAQEQKKLDVYKAIAKQLEGKTLKIGAKARVIRGIFTGSEGEVIRLESPQKRIALLLSILGSDQKVELPLDDVEGLPDEA